MSPVKLAQRMWIVYTKGRYSQEYVNFFKQNYGFLPFNTCLKNALNHYLIQFFKKNAPVYTTRTEIKFGDIPFGYSFAELFKLKGIPNCFTVDPIENAVLKVVRYTEKVLKSNMSVTYFFLKDKFFLGEYRFGDITNINLPDVIKTLSKRYELELPETSEEFLITDSSGLLIHYIFNGIAASIRYFSKVDSDIQQVISDYLSRTDNVRDEDTDLETVLTQHL